MKRLLFFLFLIAPFCLQAQSSSSKSSEPTYLRFPEVPPFAMTTPSGKVFMNKDLQKHKPVMIFLFSVDCEHCQHQTKEITKNIARFKGTQIVMITPFEHNEMTAFYRGYGVNHYPGIITMGSDSTRKLNMFYQQHFFPGIYIYNKHNKLVYHHEGTAKIDTLVHYLKD
ncbi:MAG TPA: redoxin domain-containing protein [Chitinophagaceae bacterium]|jgi:cytochrome oxidase Cu insertion factor (SCO1/SenC/PrrC family)|nr:redoxin domain-containing protein [Chitinophagaceae bacterium]